MSTIALEKPNLTHTLCFMFSGKAGVGKSYCSDLLFTLLRSKGLAVYRLSFARGVKSTASFMGWDGNKDKRGRRLLQKIGQIGREYDADMWVRSGMREVEESVGYPYDAIIIDDWRFGNEFNFIVNNEPLYKVVDIRVSALNRECLRGTPEYNEISETELDDFAFRYTINNREPGPFNVANSLSMIAENEIKLTTRKQ
jgi:hypothetical protein